MANLLYIIATPKKEADSITLKMSNAFIEAYKQANPDDTVETIELYSENLRFLSEQDIGEMFSGMDTDMKAASVKFAEADKYVFAAPMWNLSFPAALHAYIDYIMQAGVLFHYTETGAMGDLRDKKAVYITARGGAYTAPPMSELECGASHMRKILNFIGVDDVSEITCELTQVLMGDMLDDAVALSIKNAENAAKSF